MTTTNEIFTTEQIEAGIEIVRTKFRFLGTIHGKALPLYKHDVTNEDFAAAGLPAIYTEPFMSKYSDALCVDTTAYAEALNAVISQRRVEERDAKYLAAIEPLPLSDAAKQILRDSMVANRYCPAEAHSLVDLFKRAIERKQDQFGKPLPAWTSVDCGAKLQPKNAVLVRYEQNSYSDDTYYMVPFTGTPNAEAMNNLSKFIRRADTHIGLAGSGVNWDVQSINTDAHVAILHCRSSISD